ncbi:MAG TPA: hypothetical protein VLM79_01755 [Kofleriaceae bacterium]|nr:hypothetical protein [Kofleriaceae bacterium]
MRKSVQKPAQQAVAIKSVARVCLERVRGGATAIEYGLSAPTQDVSLKEPTTLPW